MAEEEYIEVVPMMREVEATRAFAQWLRVNAVLWTAFEPREIAQELISDAQGRNWAIFRIKRSAFTRLGLEVPKPHGG